MLFSGLCFPMQLIPGVFDDISHFTPLGAAVEALQDSMLGYLARRFFRWE